MTEEQRFEGYNNNLMGGKRRKKNYAKYGHMSLIDRMIAESEALWAYQQRVGQGKAGENGRPIKRHMKPD